MCLLGRFGHDRCSGDTSADIISAIIADEAAIGMINRKTTAVRIIPAPGKSERRLGGIWRVVRQSSGNEKSILIPRKNLWLLKGVSLLPSML